MSEGASQVARALSQYSFEVGEAVSPEALQIRLRQQAVVAELGEMALRGASLQTLFEEAVQGLREVLDVDYAKVLKNQPVSGTARLVAGVGWDWTAEGMAVSTGLDSQAGYTLECDGPVIVTDLAEEARFSGPSLLLEHGVVSGMSVVIRGPEEEPYGVLGVHSRSHRLFTQYDVHFLQAVANVLATNIQKAASEAALRRSEETFREAFEQAGVGIVITDVDGRFQEVNPAFEQLVGYSRAELVDGGMTVFQVTHPEDRIQIQEEAARLSAEKMDSYSLEKRYRHRNGSTVWALVTVARLPENHNFPMQFVGIAQDITQRHEAEQALEDADRHKDEFLSMLGHELRNPLTPITTMSQHLVNNWERTDHHRVQEAVSIIYQQSTHLARMVEDLLDLSRIKRGRLALQMEPALDARKAVRQAMDSIAPQVEENRHTMRVELPDHPLPTAGDPTRLTQIVANLLGNATKFTPADGTIQVRCAREGKQVVIAVSDDGKGIPKARLRTLFRDFDQKGFQDSELGGLGLGLSLVRRLVEMHGGEIEAESPGENQGSIFRVYLPAC
ncbi:PAS domain S-box protein [Thiohalorhabdus methylotrophus]|uniref:histidine kinase n=1 Tax=Thiohalorhabdus methylotrophus TaxID=3242694 RepID=A0ABV4TV75_9GAMM